MTLEPQGGTTTTIPAFAYHGLVCLSIMVSTLLGLSAVGLDVLPVWATIVLMCLGPILTYLVGYSQPVRSEAQAAKAQTAAMQESALAAAKASSRYSQHRTPDDTVQS